MTASGRKRASQKGATAARKRSISARTIAPPGPAGCRRPVLQHRPQHFLDEVLQRACVVGQHGLRQRVERRVRPPRIVVFDNIGASAAARRLEGWRWTNRRRGTFRRRPTSANSRSSLPARPCGTPAARRASHRPSVRSVRARRVGSRRAKRPVRRRSHEAVRAARRCRPDCCRRPLRRRMRLRRSFDDRRSGLRRRMPVTAALRPAYCGGSLGLTARTEPAPARLQRRGPAPAWHRHRR